jgi:hypothetical protein
MQIGGAVREVLFGNMIMMLRFMNEIDIDRYR